MLRSRWVLLLGSLIFFTTPTFAVTDSTAIPRSTSNVASGYNLINVMHMVSNAPANYTGTCPAGTAFSGGQFVGGTAGGYYIYNCAYLNVPANSQLATQIAAMAQGFTPCPEDPGNSNLQCTTKFNSYPITILQTNSCANVYCHTSVMFGNNNDGYAHAFTPVGNSPTITILSTNGTRGGGWDYRNSCQNESCNGYNVLSISAYVFPNTTYQVYIKTYREGGWQTRCPVYLTNPPGSADKGDYNGVTITFSPQDIGKTCMFECAGNVGGKDDPYVGTGDAYQDSITKYCY